MSDNRKSLHNTFNHTNHVVQNSQRIPPLFQKYQLASSPENHERRQRLEAELRSLHHQLRLLKQLNQQT